MLCNICSRIDLYLASQHGLQSAFNRSQHVFNNVLLEQCRHTCNYYLKHIRFYTAVCLALGCNMFHHSCCVVSERGGVYISAGYLLSVM